MDSPCHNSPVNMTICLFNFRPSGTVLMLCIMLRSQGTWLWSFVGSFHAEGRGHLRSAPVSSSFSRTLALSAHIASCGIWARATAAAAAVRTWVAVTFDILHRFIVFIGSAVVIAVDNLRKFAGDINLFALQESVNDVADSPVAWAEPGGVATACLGSGLEPEKVSLRGGAKLEDKYAPVRSGGVVFGILGIERQEPAICGDHDKVKLRLI